MFPPGADTLMLLPETHNRQRPKTFMGSISSYREGLQDANEVGKSGNFTCDYTTFSPNSQVLFTL
ncbi:MAG: hypothetical protein ACUVV0_15590, partial [Anaerolineae bacterium]